MKSKIGTGLVLHQRLYPTQHFFQYPHFFYVFDVDELPGLAKQFFFFGYNQKRLVSLWDQDYLTPGTQSLRSKVINILKQNQIDTEPSKIKLLSSAKFLGHVFNPISFFYCYDAQDKIFAVLVQVNNTFHETHLYLLENPQMGQIFTAAKSFYVSPFFKVTGEYQFTLSNLEDEIQIQVDLIQNKQTVLKTQIQGKLQTLSTRIWLQTLFKYPFNVFLVLPRISWQAFLLHFQKKLPIIQKPGPLSSNTLRKAPPKWHEKLAMHLLFQLGKRLAFGQLFIKLPNGQEKILGKTGPQINIQVNGYRAFWHTLLHTDVGFAESYLRGDIEIENLTQTLLHLSHNAQLLRSHKSFFASIGESINRRFHLNRENHLGKASENIQEHYDLGNEFFKLFLDPTLMYSSALFSENESLFEAQQHKIHRLLSQLDLKPEHHLLEIGSGWGAVALAAAQKYGCRVSTITLSEKQKEYVDELIQQNHLSHLVDVKLIDYRLLSGKYDRIVSVEMLEAVGHAYLGVYFKTCEQLLKPNGKMMLQVITISHDRYEYYLNRCDFIQKHIFPGGHLPSLEILEEKIQKNTQLRIVDRLSIGKDYAKTLSLWRENFIRARSKIFELGFDESFYRKWLYYFSYCEAGFQNQMIDDYQLLLTNTTNITTVADLN